MAPHDLFLLGCVCTLVGTAVRWGWEWYAAA